MKRILHIASVPLKRTSLATGNWIASVIIVLLVGFAVGWIAHAITKPLLCWFAA